jgi:hypothetical protein
MEKERIKFEVRSQTLEVAGGLWPRVPTLDVEHRLRGGVYASAQ